MLVGYVSDERYVALPNTLLEFTNGEDSIEASSRATGAVYADVEPGVEYQVTLYREGFGNKRATVTPDEAEPYQFRMLADGLLGYAWPKWVRAGEKAEFRVHSVEQYKLTLWRYGWEKEHIETLGWFDEHGPRATMQITPDGDYTQTGAQFNKQGYASPHHLQYATAPEKSGLYYFHAKTESGRFFSFPWIVAPATPQSKVAVIASNITWNCYNNFGGRSNYINSDALPPTPTVNARCDLQRYTNPEHTNYQGEEYDPLSFDRPEPINHINEDEQITDPIEGRAACHIAPAEWRLLGWMEKSGLDYDLYAETQLHSGVLNLDDYKLLIISTHPEYWSKEMYYGLKDWVFNRGGKLMYLGGNGLNCEVEFLDDSTITVKNEDVRRQWAEKHDSRMAMRLESEANLLGVVFSETGIMTGAPYKVIYDSHWIFEGTELKNGDIFGEKYLHMRCPGGASGHETDKMSPASPANTKLLAKGLNPEDGGAHIVHFETPSGGEVFSVGSISWPSCVVVDENVAKITANVIQRFSE